MKSIALSIGIAAGAVLSGCGGSGAEPIYYGEDNCTNCRMTIFDRKFGCELVTEKGKAFKFDSIECLVAYEAGQDNGRQQIASVWVTDFQRAGTLIQRNKAYFVRSSGMRSPMGVGLFAFSSGEEAESFANQHDGVVMDLKTVRMVVDDVW